MKCFHPIDVNTSDGYKQVPCGKCAACLMRYRDSWRIRLEREFEAWNYYGIFVTLTIDDEHLVIEDNGIYKSSLDKSQASDFLKSFRNAMDYRGLPFKYFLVGEYGSKTFRPHYHALIFANGEDIQTVSELVQKFWTLGFVMVDQIIPERIQYVCKYTLKQLVKECEDKGLLPPFAMMSKGIGSSFINSKLATDFYGRAFRPYAIDLNSYPASLPRYYKERLYSPAEWQAYASDNVRKDFAELSRQLGQPEYLGKPFGIWFAQEQDKASERRLNRILKEMHSKDIL